MLEIVRHETPNSIDPVLRSFAPRHHESPTDFPRIQGVSAAMQDIFRAIEKVAVFDVSVMIIGESGCGKDLVAQAIHAASPRRSAPFVAVNCGALSAGLLESELFGHERGAFTGAVRAHHGVFERAEGGTLFLDEITEMPLDGQARLLRVLESGVLTRLGGDREITCDTRVLAATNRDPALAVRESRLRQDLFYRLAVFPLAIPPLRERPEDIMPLARHFLEEHNLRNGTRKRFAPGAEKKLRGHEWPGNVRELKNCIERACIMADPLVDVDHFFALESGAGHASGDTFQFEVGTPLQEVERQVIVTTIDRFGGDKPRAARSLGISLKTIYNRLNRYGAQAGNAARGRSDDRSS